MVVIQYFLQLHQKVVEDLVLFYHLHPTMEDLEDQVVVVDL
tara:strand:- start:518 stop:640 length:123 start_codon:yes stop_codon:yes gene_type:complete